MLSIVVPNFFHGRVMMLAFSICYYEVPQVLENMQGPFRSLCIVNNMAADALAMQGVKASAAMVLT